MGLITLAAAKTHLGVSGSDDDDTINLFIAAATGAMEEAATRHLEAAVVTEFISGCGTRLLRLNEPPDGGHGGVTTIHIDSARAWAAASLVDADDYFVDGSVVEYLDRIWTWGQRNIRAIYNAGVAAVPEDLQQACNAQVAKLYAEWQNAKKGMNALESQNVMGWTQKFLAHAGLDPETADIVARYIPARL